MALEKTGPERPTKRLLFLVTEDWYFCSHRLPLAQAAHDAGYEVIVVTRVTDHAETIRARGFTLVPIDMKRGSTRPWVGLVVLFKLFGIYRAQRPDIVHHVSLKPVIYGSLVAQFSRKAWCVNAVTGFGSVFSSKRLIPRLVRPIVRQLLARLLRGSRSQVIVQNRDDERSVRDLGCKQDRIHLIPGSGVDTALFAPSDEPDGTPTFVLVARMLWDKGVGDLVEAARITRASARDLRVVLVGAPDPENPSSIDRETLTAWRNEGTVEWWGHRDDIVNIWRQAHVAVLPSHREGFPKSLLEGAASGRPLLATDVPGCRELVEDGVNGFLVPPHDPHALAQRMLQLASDKELRRSMGNEARHRSVARYSESTIAEKTVSVYRSLVP